jgi:predicted metalloprotease with PDZ domain
LIDEALWFRKLERYLARYVIGTTMWPVERLSLVDAGKDKHENWLLIYGGGATMALALDIEIRAATEGSRGLDDVMRRLEERFGEPGSRYTVDDVLAAVNHVSGGDFTDFFDAYVKGAEAQLDIAGTLAKAGLSVEQFADEFYLSRAEQPTRLQRKIFRGITTAE